MYLFIIMFPLRLGVLGRVSRGRPLFSSMTKRGRTNSFSSQPNHTGNVLNVNTQQDHVKRVLETLKKDLNIQTAAEWALVTPTFISKAGGVGIVTQKTLFHNLTKTYPEENWKQYRSVLDPSYWDSVDNQRLFLESVRQFYDVKSILHLYTISDSLIQRAGGKYLRAKYASKIEMLRTVYPECKWPPFTNTSHIKSVNDQKKFIHHVEAALGLQKLEDWRNVSTTDFKKMGGSTMLLQYGNLYNCLTLVHHIKDELVVRKRVSNGFSQTPAGQAKYIKQLKEKFPYEKMDDWYSLTRKQMVNMNKRMQTLPSPFELLPQMFPKYKWDFFRFSHPHSFWSESSIHHVTFVHSLAKHLGLSHPAQFTRFSFADFTYHQGKRCFEYYHSFLELLLFVYPAQRDQILHEAPSSFWADRNNVTTLLHISLKNVLPFQRKSEWMTLSFGMFAKKPGFLTLLQRHNTLANVLSFVFPKLKWSPELFNHSDSIPLPRKQLQCASKLFFFHSKLSLECMHLLTDIDELVDVFLPDYKTVFLFHGPEHYDGMESFLEKQAADKQKKALYQEKGYNLVIFPHWSDFTPDSIRIRLLGAGADELERKVEVIHKDLPIHFLRTVKKTKKE